MNQTPYSLIERLQNGPRAADWEQLVRIYTPWLRGWLAPNLPQEADIDDLVQDVLTVVVSKFADFRYTGYDRSFRSWLRSIVVFRLKDFWRKQLRVPNAMGADRLKQFLDRMEQPESDDVRRWDLEHDRHVVSQLLESIRGEFTPVTWDAFLRYAVAGDSPTEVASRLGVSTNVVFIARSRILRRLREEAGCLLNGDTELAVPNSNSP